MGVAGAMEEGEEDTATTAATVGEADRSRDWVRPHRGARGRDPAERKTRLPGDRGKRKRRKGLRQAREQALGEEGELDEEERVG